MLFILFLLGFILSFTTNAVLAQESVLNSCDPLEFKDNSITFVIIPDTQHYALNDTNNDIFKSMTQWIADNVMTRNIQAVLHVGDITNDNSDGQWIRAKESISILDNVVPYILTTGNHDGFENTKLNDYFKITDNTKNQAIYSGSFIPNRIENAYYKLTTPNGRKFLILVLEYEKRQTVLDWTSPIITANSDYEVIILTHEIMNEVSRITTGQSLRSMPDTPGNPEFFLFPESNCGQKLWEKLTSLHKNMIMTFNGHYHDYDGDGLATGHRADGTVYGNQVFQVLFNAQDIENGGDGWLRLVEFQPDGTIQQKTFSPYLNQWKISEEYQFIDFPRVADIDRNSKVNLKDYAIFAQKWGLESCGWANGSDVDGNNIIDVNDLALISKNWLTDYSK